jgi:glyoxylase-like metal-dependent hydrolase (beta-lactamase superfamily II)
MNRLRGGRRAAALGSTLLVLAAVTMSYAEQPRSSSASSAKMYLDGQAVQPELRRITEHLWIYPGPINVGILRDGRKALLIDCGDGAVAGRLGELGVNSVDLLIFTHHHRDQACGAPPFVAAGTKIGVPEAERGFFEWPKLQWQWECRYNNMTLNYPSGPMFALTEGLKVDAGYTDGQKFTWGPAELKALATPGHTAGSMSYAVNVDGKRVVFCGDAIYDEGRVWDLYSLNREYGPCGPTVTDKHGQVIRYRVLGWADYEAFLGARQVLEKSLGRVKQSKPDLLVPSHGRIMSDPAKAIDALAARLDVCFDNYIAISHLRWDFADYYEACTDSTRQDFLPLWKDGKVGATLRNKAAPPCVSHRGETSWVLKSKDGAALVTDYENGAEKELQKMVAKGEITGVECLWITHYHDDHCRAGVVPFRKAFPRATVIADSHVAQVITEPSAWPPLPCLNPEKVQVDRVTKDGESWRWHEFKLTAYHFPGQTLYHGGLLAETGDLRILFVGDALTAGGIEDYCAFNRNWLGRGRGYDRCLELVEKLQPTHLLYAHRDQAFAYTVEDCQFMRANLARREKLFAELLPWDDPNYGLDGWWVMCRPYEVHVQAGNPQAGARAAFDVVLMNHSAVSRTAACRAVPPRTWGTPALLPASLADTSDWPKAQIPPKTEGRVHLTLAVPAGVPPGRYVVPVDVRYGSRVLPQFTVVLIMVDR